MVPAIRNILGGFLFSGDDVYKKAGVLSGGERTRLAVARMLLRPSNTLLLDEPTNHLDLDSKDVLLDALADYGGTLIFVSHDRYFVERLATKIVEVGDGGAGCLSRARTPSSCGARNTAAARRSQLADAVEEPRTPVARRARQPRAAAPAQTATAPARRAGREPRPTTRPQSASAPSRRRRDSELQARRPRLADLEGAHRRARARDQGARGDDGRARLLRAARCRRKPVIDRHQALMWEVGELMHQWEMLPKLTPKTPAAICYAP